MNKEIKTLEDLENYCKKNTGHGINVPPFVYIDKYFEDIEKAYENGYRAGYEEGSNYSVDEEAKESDNVKNSLMAIKATQKQSCEEEDVAKAFQLGLTLGLCEKHNEEDCISRQAVLDRMKERDEELSCLTVKDVMELQPVTPQPKIGRCKDCKYFEYDSVAKVNGIPLIVAHEICKRWGDGCQSKEDGYCFLFEPKPQEVEK